MLEVSSWFGNFWEVFRSVYTIQLWKDYGHVQNFPISLHTSWIAYGRDLVSTVILSKGIPGRVIPSNWTATIHVALINRSRKGNSSLSN